MTRGRGKSRLELLGIHGLVLRSSDPAALARRWTELTGLEPLRRTRTEVVLGGPELFVVVRRGSSRDAVEEVHFAVEDISVTRRRARPDPLGGDSWKKGAGPLDLVMREFRRPPSPRWRKKRRRSR